MPIHFLFSFKHAFIVVSEHCEGVVSLKALLELGVIPDKLLLDNIRITMIYFPSRKSIEILPNEDVFSKKSV